MSLRLRPLVLDPGTIADLKPGSVLRLTHPAAAPLEVSFAGNTFAHATPGARGQRLAALIVTTPSEDQ